MDKLTQYRPELGVYVRVSFSMKLSMMATIFEFDRLNHILYGTVGYMTTYMIPVTTLVTTYLMFMPQELVLVWS